MKHVSKRHQKKGFLTGDQSISILLTIIFLSINGKKIPKSFFCEKLKISTFFDFLLSLQDLV